MRLLIRPLVVIGLLVLLAAPATALAHQKVSSSSPARGSTVKPTITKVTVTFDGDHIQSGTLKVTGPGGKVVSIGSGGRDPRNDNRLSVRLRSGLANGSYTVRWTIVAADGHHQSGSYGFKVKK